MIAPCNKCQDTGMVQGLVARIADRPADEPCACTPKERDIVADCFDGIVWRTLNEKQAIDRIVTDFIGNPDTAAPWRSTPTQDRVERYVGRLVTAFGAKIGGLSRKQLVSKVMRRFEAYARKKYHSRA